MLFVRRVLVLRGAPRRAIRDAPLGYSFRDLLIDQLLDAPGHVHLRTGSSADNEYCAKKTPIINEDANPFFV